MVKLFGRDSVLHNKTKYSFVKHIIDKKRAWVKMPHFRNMHNYILARKLLSMNYIFPGSYPAESYECKDLDDWKMKVKSALDLPPFMKYTKRTLRIPRTKVNPEAKLSLPAPTPAEEVDNPVNPICDLKDLAMNSSRHLFESELAKKAEEETEDWQRRNWRQQIAKDYKSANVSEVIVNSRMAALSTRDVKSHPTLNVIFMENIRYAVYTHQWRLALKGVEGLLEELTAANKCWLTWNGGFLAIANMYKDDVHKFIEFATYTKDYMYCYPRRLGVEVAAWLNQKGYFTQGFQLLEEWHETNRKLGTWEFVRDKENSKRKIIDLIAILMKATFQYSCWKRDKKLKEEGTYSGDEFSLKRCGETALELFESLIVLSGQTGTDTTVFLEQLIELEIEFRDAFEAREVFKTIVLQNYGNGVVEALYLEFLQTYFPFLDDEINLYIKRQENFKFFKQKLPNKKFDQMLQFQMARKYKRKEAVPLVRKEKPGFSL